MKTAAMKGELAMLEGSSSRAKSSSSRAEASSLSRSAEASSSSAISPPVSMSEYSFAKLDPGKKWILSTGKCVDNEL